MNFDFYVGVSVSRGPGLFFQAKGSRGLLRNTQLHIMWGHFSTRKANAFGNRRKSRRSAQCVRLPGTHYGRCCFWWLPLNGHTVFFAHFVQQHVGRIRASCEFHTQMLKNTIMGHRPGLNQMPGSPTVSLVGRYPNTDCTLRPEVLVKTTVGHWMGLLALPTEIAFFM